MGNENYNFVQGQRVAVVFSHWGRRIERIEVIDRVTNTLAIVGCQKFNRSSGREHGNRYGSTSIEPATAEVLAEFREQNRKSRRADFLKQYLDGNWRSMGDENLDKIAAALGFSSLDKAEGRS